MEDTCLPLGNRKTNWCALWVFCLNFLGLDFEKQRNVRFLLLHKTFALIVFSCYVLLSWRCSAFPVQQECGTRFHINIFHPANEVVTIKSFVFHNWGAGYSASMVTNCFGRLQAIIEFQSLFIIKPNRPFQVSGLIFTFLVEHLMKPLYLSNWSPYNMHSGSWLEESQGFCSCLF